MDDDLESKVPTHESGHAPRDEGFILPTAIGTAVHLGVRDVAFGEANLVAADEHHRVNELRIGPRVRLPPRLPALQVGYLRPRGFAPSASRALQDEHEDHDPDEQGRS